MAPESPTGTVTGGVAVEEPRCRRCRRGAIMTRAEIADTLTDALEMTDGDSEHPRRVTDTAERLGCLTGTEQGRGGDSNPHRRTPTGT